MPLNRRSALAAMTALSVLSCARESRAQNASLVGVWRRDIGSAASELVIKPNGQFSKLDTVGAAQTLITGIVSVTADPPTLRLVIQDYEPKEFCGPLGCSPIQMVAAEIYGFAVDADTLTLTDANGRYAFRRAE